MRNTTRIGFSFALIGILLALGGVFATANAAIPDRTKSAYIFFRYDCGSASNACRWASFSGKVKVYDKGTKRSITGTITANCVLGDARLYTNVKRKNGSLWWSGDREISDTACRHLGGNTSTKVNFEETWASQSQYVIVNLCVIRTFLWDPNVCGEKKTIDMLNP